MKITFKIEKEKLIWVAVAMSFALVMFFQVGYSAIALVGFGVFYFVIQGISIETKEKWAWLWTVLMLGISAVFSVYLVQYLLLDAELRAKISDEKMLLNILCALVLYLVVQAFTCRADYTCMIAHITLMILAGVNYFVFLFRGNEFIFSDLRSIQTGLSVAGNYEFMLDERAMYVILSSILYVALVRRLQVTFKEKKGWVRMVCVALAVFSSIYVAEETVNTVTETWEQKGSYRNGYILNFVLSVRDYFVAEPEGYSEEVIAELEAEYADEEQEVSKEGVLMPDGSVKKPTVIVVMSESYSNLGVVGDFLTNAEVTPFYNSLSENTMKGYALSSVFGAKTPNSEWEFMTGNSMAFLPSGSVVYQQYISDEPTSLVSDMKNKGYTCVAMHPYYETGWSRNSVYPDMGFDEMYFLDDFDQTQLLREYVTDAEFYDRIIERFENKSANEDLFIMSISMQNHGGYTESYDNFEEQIRVLGANYTDANQYLSLLHESDQMLEEFITYFEQVEEPVEIVFFGDHLPSLDTDFFKSLNGKGLSNLTVNELERLYTVPFFIWTNYDSAETDVPITSLNYLSTMALERAGLELPTYNCFLKDMQECIPAINARGYYSLSDGCYKHIEEATGEEAEWIRKYETLQYNNMFDKKGKSELFFPYLSDTVK